MRQFAPVGLAFVVCSPAGASPQRLVDVTQTGVIGDGATLNTLALQNAIDACSAQGGGVLAFPAGRFVTGTIQLKDNVTLRLDAQAVLVGSANAADYRNVDPFTDGTGAALGYALITAVNARHVGLEGPGAIDGQGAALKAAQNPYAIRPFLVRWVRCSDVVVRNIELRNSGAWTMHLFQSKNAAFERVTIRSRGLANNDGIDIDSSETVRITDCDIDTGDDAICLKTTSAQACHDITVTGCRLTSNCAAIKLGTESLGDFDKIRVAHCQIRDTRLGGIKVLSVDGANLHDVAVSDVTMERVTVPIMLRLGARLKTFRPGDSARPVGALHDIVIRNVRATESGQIGLLLSGVPGHLLENIALENVDLQLAGGGKPEDGRVSLAENESDYPEVRMFGPTLPAYGIYARHVRGLKLTNVRTAVIAADARPERVFVDVEDPVAGQSAPAWGDWPAWGDQGDGTYRNPVLPSDYSDLDCIRVGADYYAISSTFQFSPGMVILHSRDLVNWTIAGHAISDLTQIGPELNWDRMNRYGKGVWAGAIRHHEGKFWVYFGTPDEGYFMTTANDVAGPWEPLHAVLPEAGWDDCCPFWDDDGQGWLVGSNFRDGYKIHLWKLTPDSRDLITESDRVIYQSRGSEASKLYKINGTYYHFFSEVSPEGRVIMMRRASSLAGPWEDKRQLKHSDRDAFEPNQGGFVEGPDGRWYFFTHHGRGSWEGRAASLLPVTWRDGWPLVGTVGADGMGNMVWSGKKPGTGTPVVTPQSSDEFASATLPPQWEWNHQPRAEYWSLTARPGFLRLHAFPPLKPDDLRTAGNTLTQRVLRTSRNVVTVALDLAGMADGQVAGLTHLTEDYSAVGVRQEAGVRTLEFKRAEKITAGPVIHSRWIWLRTEWGLDGVSRYYSSVDGTSFTPVGEPVQLVWAHYRGDRVGIFSYNNKTAAGYVDADWFHYDYAGPASP